MSPSPAIRGSPVTLTCTTSPAGVATSYRWLLDGRLVSTNSVYEISSAQPSHDGSYVCEASNDFGQADTSNTPLAMSVSCEYASSYDYVFVLTLKAPRKKCIWKCLLLKSSAANNCLTLLTHLIIEANRVDPDQTAPIGAVWSGSTLFVIEAS